MIISERQIQQLIFLLQETSCAYMALSEQGKESARKLIAQIVNQQSDKLIEIKDE